jgi:hypothetical protein
MEGLLPDFMLKMPYMNPKAMSTLGHTFRYAISPTEAINV